MAHLWDESATRRRTRITSRRQRSRLLFYTRPTPFDAPASPHLQCTTPRPPTHYPPRYPRPTAASPSPAPRRAPATPPITTPHQAAPFPPRPAYYPHTSRHTIAATRNRCAITRTSHCTTRHAKSHTALQTNPDVTQTHTRSLACAHSRDPATSYSHSPSHCEHFSQDPVTLPAVSPQPLRPRAPHPAQTSAFPRAHPNPTPKHYFAHSATPHSPALAPPQNPVGRLRPPGPPRGHPRPTQKCRKSPCGHNGPLCGLGNKNSRSQGRAQGRASGWPRWDPLPLLQRDRPHQTHQSQVSRTLTLADCMPVWLARLASHGKQQSARLAVILRHYWQDSVSSGGIFFFWPRFAR